MTGTPPPRVLSDDDLEALGPLRGTLVVTGGTGLIGRAVLAGASELAALAGPGGRPRLIAVARRPAAAAGGVETIPGDVGDPALWESLRDAERVVHVAGETSNYLDDPLNTVASATVGLELGLRSGAGREGFVFVSSVRVYGRHPAEDPVTESCPVEVPLMHPDLVYDAAKALGEALVRLHATRDGGRGVVVRLANVYGEGLAPGSRTSITDWLDQGRTEGRIELRGPADTVRNHCHQFDAARGILRALVLGRAGEAYNVGSRENLTNLEAAGIVGDHLGVPVEARPGSGPPSRVRVSIEKAARELGFEPRHRLAAFLAERAARPELAC